MMQPRREDQFAARISLLPINLDLADVLDRLAGSGRKPGEIQHRHAVQSRDPKPVILGGSYDRISVAGFFQQQPVGAAEFRVIDRVLPFVLPTSQVGGADAYDASRSAGNPQLLLDRLDLSRVEEWCDSHQLAVLQTAQP